MKKLVLLSGILMNLMPAFGSDVSGEESSPIASAAAPASPLPGQRRITNFLDYTPRSAVKVAVKRFRTAAAAVELNEDQEEIDDHFGPLRDYESDTESSDDDLPPPSKTKRAMTEKENKFEDKARSMLPAGMGAVARIGFALRLKSWLDLTKTPLEHFADAHFILNMERVKPTFRRDFLSELATRIDRNPDPSVKIQGADLVLRCIKRDDDFYYSQHALESLQSFFNVRSINGFEKYIILAATSILKRTDSMHVPEKKPSREYKVSSDVMKRATGSITPLQFTERHISPHLIISKSKELAMMALARVMAGENALERTNAAVVFFKNSSNEFESLNAREMRAFHILKEYLRTRSDLGDRFDFDGVPDKRAFERIKAFYAQGTE